MAGDEEIIDFISLETELNQAIQNDVKYWQQNDAKIRAVNQRVATYDDFREIVNAAHLKPLSKTESLQIKTELVPRSCLWNSISSTNKKLTPLKQSSASEKRESNHRIGEHSTLTSNLVHGLHNANNPTERYEYLKTIGLDVFDTAFQTEIPFDTLADIIGALQNFPDTTSDIIFVTRTLQTLARTKRFNISLAFFNSEEKSQCEDLLQKLSSSIQSRQQNLSEQNITEGTVSNLMSLFKM